MDFDWNLLSLEDFKIALRYVPSMRKPDLVIAPDGEPYLYRWHMLPRAAGAGMYFHIQVASDPERPLHTHPWDNMSVILAGGYVEHLQQNPPASIELMHWRRPGGVIFRRATEAHRLILPEGVPYTMSQFSFGPKVNEWGFWYPDGFRRYQEVTETNDGVSVHKKGTDAARWKEALDAHNAGTVSDEVKEKIDGLLATVREALHGTTY